MAHKFLIYVDILGFEKLPAQISRISGFEEDHIREKFLSEPLRKCVENLRTNNSEIGRGTSEIEGSDNVLLVVDDLQTVFETIGKVSTLKIPHRDFSCIPVEIAIGIQKIDKGIDVEPTNRKEIIAFLKNDIIKPYRHYYKERFKSDIKESFVVLTQDIFERLDCSDKTHCTPIKFSNKSFFALSMDRVKQRFSLLTFLSKIGYSQSRLYGRIDSLYVPPIEYEEIKNTLRDKRIVFITGTREYGKTYTAVRLMWEYYQNGYEPRWIHGEESTERKDVRERLENIDAELQSKHIIYFEDPFGKTKYESREGLERKIGTIIDCIRKVKDVYVIITSREETFKEFEKEHLSSIKLKEFESILNLKKPSYGYEERIEILFSWAEELCCKWFSDKASRVLLKSELEDESNLPTILSLKDFAIVTSDVTDLATLMEKLREKSIETAKAFTHEIENMSHDKKLFLAFLFIGEFPVDFIRSTYQALLDDLTIKNAWSFDNLVDWFRDDKITIEGFYPEYITFAHPSYSEAIDHLLADNRSINETNFNELFYKLLNKLSVEPTSSWDVARFLEVNFDKLPQNMRDELLLKLAEYFPSEIVSLIIMNNFNNINIRTRNELLVKLSNNRGTAQYAAWIIKFNYQNIPEQLRTKLLLHLSKIATSHTAFFYTEDVLLPETICMKTSGSSSASVISLIVRDKYDQLNEEVRTELLLKLSKLKTSAEVIAKIVSDRFDKFDGHIRDELLLNLSELETSAEVVAAILINKMDSSHNAFRINLFFKLAENDVGSKTVASAIAENAIDLPENIRNALLLKLSENNVAGQAVAYAIAELFDEIPEDTRNAVLFRLSENVTAASTIAEIVENRVADFSEETISKLRLKLRYMNYVRKQT